MCVCVYIMCVCVCNLVFIICVFRKIITNLLQTNNTTVMYHYLYRTVDDGKY